MAFNWLQYKVWIYKHQYTIYTSSGVYTHISVNTNICMYVSHSKYKIASSYHHLGVQYCYLRVIFVVKAYMYIKRYFRSLHIGKNIMLQHLISTVSKLIECNEIHELNQCIQYRFSIVQYRSISFIKITSSTVSHTLIFTCTFNVSDVQNLLYGHTFLRVSKYVSPDTSVAMNKMQISSM